MNHEDTKTQRIQGRMNTMDGMEGAEGFDHKERKERGKGSRVQSAPLTAASNMD